MPPFSCVEQQGVASRDEQCHEGGEGFRVLNGRRKQVRLHVVNGHERPAQPEGDRLRPANANQECSDQPRAYGDAERIDVTQ